MIGKRIGNYVVMQLLGQGGMGAVYLAKNPDIDREVAIKLLPEELTHGSSNVQRFIAEAKAVASIDHPNIIDIYDFGRTDEGVQYYVMEVLKGRELQRVVSEAGRMSVTTVLPYVEQLCSALHVVHERGIVHRDLKPNNIFVLDRQPLQIKVLDFGVAKLLDATKDSHLTATGVTVGTPLTMAPEQAANADQIGPQTDLYAVGVLLYWMLAGQPPFYDEVPALLLAQHIKQPPPPLRDFAPDVPPLVAKVVEQCLEKVPEDRPESALALYNAFAEAVAAEARVWNLDGIANGLAGEERPVDADGTAADAGYFTDCATIGASADAAAASEAAPPDEAGAAPGVPAPSPIRADAKKTRPLRPMGQSQPAESVAGSADDHTAIESPGKRLGLAAELISLAIAVVLVLLVT